MAVAVAKRTNGARPVRPAHVDPVEFDHEEIVVRRGERSGLPMVIAVHSTALGPALGGVRMWRYADVSDGVRDAMRLAAGMTYKAAAAGLDLGGGKGVICLPAGGFADEEERRDALLDFADLVETLDGRYITAEDVGVAPDDIVVMSRRTSHLTGLPPELGGSGDPSPLTALGVQAAMRACAQHAFGQADLAGRRVGVIGLGHVGGHLARRVVAAGAQVIACDVDPSKRALASELGAAWVDPEAAVATDCDILAPCALGGTIDDQTVEELRCRIVCGSANNQLAHEDLAQRLAERGILYAPDFIANAGGLMNVNREIRGHSAEQARQQVLGIEGTMERILTDAEAHETTPHDAAIARARNRLRAARSRGRDRGVPVRD
jgi:leucine dehydrogenase